MNVTFDSIDLGNKDYMAPYRGEFNKVPPTFKGMPRDYYPTTCLSLCQSCFMICIIYVVCAALFMGLLLWGLESAKTVGIVSLIAFIVYLIIIVVMVYFGSAERKKKEREYIR